jgi:hypothetical protein
MLQRLKVLIVGLALSAAVAACDSGDEPVAQGTARPDSASGEVAQYALMKNTVGWLTDSNIVALASQVNSDAQGMARLESQAWTREPFRLLAAEIMRDHARMQFAIDSLAQRLRIPAQLPAVAAELKAPYDSIVASQVGLPLTEREAQFLDMIAKEHARSTTDFGALAGNATDPDLKALLATRGVLMEQTHIARARVIAGAMQRADSARQDSVQARRGRRP